MSEIPERFGAQGQPLYLDGQPLPSADRDRKGNLRIREYAVEKDDAFYDIIDSAAFTTGCRCQPVLASAKVASGGIEE